MLSFIYPLTSADVNQVLLVWVRVLYSVSVSVETPELHFEFLTGMERVIKGDAIKKKTVYFKLSLPTFYGPRTGSVITFC
jgi:hypothetical protein